MFQLFVHRYEGAMG